EAYEKAVEVLEAANPKMDGLTADDELRWYISFLRPHVRQRKLPIEETIMIRRMAEFFRTLHMRARQDRIRLATAAIQ
ncbi:MAG TPA: hypothetical protein VHA30_00235, partial [Patescibacteria group bacterium]|nr:hypothetical protein [Patescibacteria group bacterium]